MHTYNRFQLHNVEKSKKTAVACLSPNLAKRRREVGDPCVRLTNVRRDLLLRKCEDESDHKLY